MPVVLAPRLFPLHPPSGHSLAASRRSAIRQNGSGRRSSFQEAFALWRAVGRMGRRWGVLGTGLGGGPRCGGTRSVASATYPATPASPCEAGFAAREEGTERGPPTPLPVHPKRGKKNLTRHADAANSTICHQRTWFLSSRASQGIRPFVGPSGLADRAGGAWCMCLRGVARMAACACHMRP